MKSEIETYKKTSKLDVLPPGCIRNFNAPGMPVSINAWQPIDEGQEYIWAPPPSIGEVPEDLFFFSYRTDSRLYKNQVKINLCITGQVTWAKQYTLGILVMVEV